MYYERVINLLFATTLTIFFSFLLFYVALGQNVGNGGEYWGFDGYERPSVAARRILASGDKRFLHVDITNPLGKRINETPLSAICDEGIFGERLAVRRSIATPLHGRDSFEKASQFAFEYNWALAFEIGTSEGVHCSFNSRYFFAKTYEPLDLNWLVAIVLIAFYIIFPILIYLLWPGRRFYREKLELVQTRIRDREQHQEQKEQVQQKLAKERRSRGYLRRLYRLFPKRN